MNTLLQQRNWDSPFTFDVKKEDIKFSSKIIKLRLFLSTLELQKWIALNKDVTSLSIKAGISKEQFTT